MVYRRQGQLFLILRWDRDNMGHTKKYDSNGLDLLDISEITWIVPNVDNTHPV